MQVPVKATPQYKPPVAFQNLNPADTLQELSGGVTSGFPLISYRGKVWRVRIAGVEHNYLDEQNQAMPCVEIVIVRSNVRPSKSYFDKTYEEGSSELPRCFSTDGIAPDAQIADPIHSQCASCPKNAWGSGKPTPSGKKSRACSDVRRMAVSFAHEIAEKGASATLYLMRVPPASLNPLKDYAEKILQPRGLYPFAVVTRVGFDPNTSHPKLTFKALRFVNDEEAEAIAALRESEEARRILSEATEFAGGGTTESGAEAGDANPHAARTVAPTPAGSPVRKPRRAAARPAEAEEATLPEEQAVEAEGGEEGGVIDAADSDDDIAPAPGSTVEEETDEIAPAMPTAASKPAAPKPVAAKPRPVAPKPGSRPVAAAPKPAPAAAPKPVRTAARPAPAATVPAAEEDFENMLDTILAD